MSYRPAVRVAVRLLGVYLLATGVPEAVRAAGYALRDFSGMTGSTPQVVFRYLYPVLSAVRIAIAVCDYPFEGLTNQKRCPECGAETPPNPGWRT